MIIYIASPYTNGCQAENVAVQMAAAHRILDMGHTPLAPLMSHYLHIYRQRPYEDWMAMDIELLKKADILLRLPGESPGADREFDIAVLLGIDTAIDWDQLYEVIRKRSINHVPKETAIPK